MAGPRRSPKSLRRALSRLLRDVRGGTAIEYGFIIALIVLAMLASFVKVAEVTTTMWSNINGQVTNAR